MIERYPLAVGIGLALSAISLLTAVAPVRRGTCTAPVGVLPLLTGLPLIGCVVVLAATSFSATLAGEAMHGWALLAHVVAGGGLCVLLALTALSFLPASLRGGDRKRLDTLGKAAVTLALLFGIAAASSILVSTFPWFGTRGLERLLDVHRFAGLAFVVTVVFASARMFRARRARQAVGQSQAKVAPVTRP